MSKPVLKYFNLPGRAEPIRQAFKIGGVDFEDQRIEFAQWGEEKPKSRLGYLPELTVDGNVFTQSQAMLRYAGRLANLYPSDPTKQLAVDEVIEILSETLNKAPKDSDKEALIKKRQEYAAGPFSDNLTFVDNLIKARGFSAGSEITIADLTLHGLVIMIKSGMFDGLDKNLTDKWEGITKVAREVSNHPKLQGHSYPAI